MKAIILVAGYATRLESVLKDKPKALADINGKPVLQRIMEKMYADIPEIDETILVSNNRYYDHFKDFLQCFSGKKITLLNDGSNSDADKRGTIGDLKFALEEANFSGEFFQVFGDNLFDFSLRDTFNFYRRKKAVTLSAFDVQSIEEAKKMGVLQIDKNYRIVGFEEKPQQPKSTLVSTGLYFFPANGKQLLNEYISSLKAADKMGTFLEWLYRRQPIYGFPCRGRWFDIGTPDTLERAKKEFTQ